MSLLSDYKPKRGLVVELPSSQPSVGDGIRERGVRLGTGKVKIVYRKAAVRGRGNASTKKRVLTPGKVDPHTAKKVRYNRGSKEKKNG